MNLEPLTMTDEIRGGHSIRFLQEVIAPIRNKVRNREPPADKPHLFKYLIGVSAGVSNAVDFNESQTLPAPRINAA